MIGVENNRCHSRANAFHFSSSTKSAVVGVEKKLVHAQHDVAIHNLPVECAALSSSPEMSFRIAVVRSVLAASDVLPSLRIYETRDRR